MGVNGQAVKTAGRGSERVDRREERAPGKVRRRDQVRGLLVFRREPVTAVASLLARATVGLLRHEVNTLLQTR